MSIATFEKVSVFGPSRCKADILSALQELGCMHLIAINPPRKTALTTISTTLLDQIRCALLYLNNSPEHGNPRLIWKDFNPDIVVKKILANQHDLRIAIDRRDFLTTRIREVSEWGEFILPPDGDLGGIKLWFYKIKLKEIARIPKNVPLHEVYRNHRYAFIIVLFEQEPQEEQFPFHRIHTGSIALEALRVELNELNEKIDDLMDERRNLTRYRYLLAREVAQFSDRTELQKASGQTQEHDEFFLLQAWVPHNELSRLTQFCQENQLSLVIEKPLPEELPPTLMESHPWLQGGAELVNFYQTPGYHALDPSIMVFFSFSIFFAMILADAGYGILLAFFAVFGWKRLGKYNAAVWLRPLLVVISLFSILYGAMLGSYFGIEPKAGTWLATLKIIDINDFKLMMLLVLIIGCLHICIASGMRAWFAQHRHERIQSSGFILLIVATLLYSIGLMKHNSTITQLAIFPFILSLLLIMIFASNEPITSFNNLAKRIVHSLGALTELPSLFGDILSYLRLFALGMAGASLAVTFNSMAQHITQFGKPSSWVLAVLILIIGQTLNFVLCFISAIVHGLRLNYIEFFKWSIKEDGYCYQPFKKQEISHE
ncbi:V-type ATP synthase subunit I [Legionella qingyii]|uniref:V-type ATP synthase subunit I n=1 Tax=Legionella qingyii TaxID=2184757 RepID=A0A317U698_9GAMM|nr:V-type ATPase 116kDa subunit family protein [Legionella qingyii]PWY56708.1 V-type ATP synthase subunit I [Legionella qingyii]RUR23737.1 V-type ATP synthase subunit I [Legionella qingyii]RUR26319.1 V-type ATP synthase subunit I [Legionella qingyii]